jgi:putative component of toxin-antitoxin plasmid stabilization module
MPVCRSRRDGVHEVRSTIRSGKVEARTFFAVEGSVMLLLHGIDGKGRQDDAIRLAIERLKDFRRRSGGGQRDG